MSNIQTHENLYSITWVLLLPDVDESSNRDGVMIMRVATKSRNLFQQRDRRNIKYVSFYFYPRPLQLLKAPCRGLPRVIGIIYHVN